MPSVDNIPNAHALIPTEFRDSPQFENPAFTRKLNGPRQVIIKLETANPIGSFKGRGVAHFMAKQAGTQPLVCASAGNFGQALAYFGQRANRDVHIFAAKTANPMKVERMRALGARTLTLVGDNYDAAAAAAIQAAEQNCWKLVSDGSDPSITEGAGTLGLELDRWPGVIDDVILPIGGGALINGTALWLKHKRPSTRIIGVCAEGAPAPVLSWRQKQPVATTTVNTIADGIAVASISPDAVSLLTKLVDEVTLVTEAHILQAMRLCLSELGLIIEPAGATGLAALLADPQRYKARAVAIPLCGGNLDPALRAQLLE